MTEFLKNINDYLEKKFYEKISVNQCLILIIRFIIETEDLSIIKYSPTSFPICENKCSFQITFLKNKILKFKTPIDSKYSISKDLTEIIQNLINIPSIQYNLKKFCISSDIKQSQNKKTKEKKLYIDFNMTKLWLFLNEEIKNKKNFPDLSEAQVALITQKPIIQSKNQEPFNSFLINLIRASITKTTFPDSSILKLTHVQYLPPSYFNRTQGSFPTCFRFHLTVSNSEI